MEDPEDFDRLVALLREKEERGARNEKRREIEGGLFVVNIQGAHNGGCVTFEILEEISQDVVNPVNISRSRVATKSLRAKYFSRQ